MKLDRQNAVVEIDQAGARAPPHHLLSIPGTLQDLQRWARRGELFGAKPIPPCSQDVVNQRRNRSRCFHRVEDVADADGVPRLEGSELPAESPAHGAVHVVYRQRNRRGDLGCVEECWTERLTEEDAYLVVA